MTQSFHTFGMLELSLNPWVGQPPALWYSVMAQINTTMTISRALIAALIQNRRLRSICLIACWRASSSPVAGAFWPLSAAVLWDMS
jgi:hypothetical protein